MNWNFPSFGRENGILVTVTGNDRHKKWENPYTIIKAVVLGHFRVK
jgi:hypothetical protein